MKNHKYLQWGHFSNETTESLMVLLTTYLKHTQNKFKQMV